MQHDTAGFCFWSDASLMLEPFFPDTSFALTAAENKTKPNQTKKKTPVAGEHASGIMEPLLSF